MRAKFVRSFVHFPIGEPAFIPVESHIIRDASDMLFKQTGNRIRPLNHDGAQALDGGPDKISQCHDVILSLCHEFS